MKYVVATYMRVGSTLICEALKGLTGQPWTPFECSHLDGQKLSEQSLQDLQACEGIVKTHSVCALDLLQSSADLHVFSTYRNFPDTILSRILYEKNVRVREGFEPIPQAKKILSIFPSVDDRSFCNMFVEMNESWLREEARTWRRYTHLVINKRSTRINYDKIANDLDALLQLLVSVVPTTQERFTQTKELIKPLAMRERFTPGFVNMPKLGRSADFFSPAALATLKGLEKQQTNKKLL